MNSSIPLSIAAGKAIFVNFNRNTVQNELYKSDNSSTEPKYLRIIFSLASVLTFLPMPFLSHQTNYHLKNLLTTCSSLSDLKRVHAGILTHGLVASLPVATKLITLASEFSPTPDYARLLFDRLSFPYPFAWNRLFRLYSDLGPCNEVLILYRSMHSSGVLPDHFTFPFVVRACAVIRAFREGKQAHGNAIKNGFGTNLFVQTGLVTMYAQSGDVSDCELVFQEMHFKNVFSWNAMIAGYTQNGVFDRAFNTFKLMVGYGEHPNEVCLVSILPALCGALYLNSGKSIHGLAIKMGSDLYHSLVNALIGMYGKCGSLDTARTIFNGMTHRSLVSWNTMIAAYEQSGQGHKAVKLFRTMQTEKVKFDSITLVSVVSACTQLGALDIGRWLHNLARQEKLEADVKIGNALMDMYAKCGCIGSAREIFDSLASKGVVSWTAMIRAYAAHGHADEALKLFSEMQDQSIRPNSFTFTSVLTACSHAGLVEEGIKFFDTMHKDFAITPTLEHYACMVDLFGRQGRLVEAYDFIQTMPIKPDTGVWGAFLGACRIHGNIDMAEFVAEGLFQSDPNNVTYYVLMKNIYSDAHRWEDVSQMRKAMKDLELKKTPGLSIVEAIRNKRVKCPLY